MFPIQVVTISFVTIFFRLDYFALGRVILYSVSSSLHFLYYRVMFDMDVFTELNKRAMCDDPHT
jgi:hypothetical protein